MLLDELLARINGAPEKDKPKEAKEIMAVTRKWRWVPNPGPQSDAFFSQADETFYGGQAGGGKTALAIGLAITQHKRSLILRRINKDAVKIVPFVKEFYSGDDGYNGQLQRFITSDGRHIDIAGCEMEDDKQRFKGDPHDLIVFDEGTDFLESQYRFIIGWNRSSDPNQRCRVLVTSNPPTTTEGQWVIKHWAPWLDRTHPNPARPGELRWFTTIAGVDTEVDGPGPHVIEGEPEPVKARSRTFIPAKLSDNPFQTADYAATLAALPDELRRAYRDGDFSVGLKDNPCQVIPTQWIVEAQNRWKPDGWRGLAMTAIAIDPAGGGKDAQEVSYRYGGWFSPCITEKGAETADGAFAAATLLKHRKDGCPVIVDVGGGYGGAVVLRMNDNGIPVVKFNNAGASTGRAKDGSGRVFLNKRAEAWWRFREALDPDQEGGSIIALPPDPELRADLAAPTYQPDMLKIKIESKEDIRDRIGRATGKGDAVVMCLAEGQIAEKKAHKSNLAASRGMQTRANVGHGQVKSYYGKH